MKYSLAEGDWGGWKLFGFPAPTPAQGDIYALAYEADAQVSSSGGDTEGVSVFTTEDDEEAEDLNVLPPKIERDSDGFWFNPALSEDLRSRIKRELLG